MLIVGSVIIILLIEFVAADLKIESVVMKPMRIGDIALNFDMKITNLNSKATYNFNVHCEKCCVIVLGNDTECSSKMVGGTFGDIFPGQSETVTLVWPTIVIFNRIGYCDIVILATKSYTEKIRLSWRIEFNTTYNIISKDNIIFDYIPRFSNTSKCSSPDLDPFDRCSPINCEAKYMGKRNFYNTMNKTCLPVPECNHSKDEIYDYLQNECVIPSNLLTESDLERFKSGEFEQYDWEPPMVNSPFTDTYDFPEELVEDVMAKKSKIFTQYSLYFSVINCAIVLFISVTFYCVLAVMVSSSLKRFSSRTAKKNEQIKM